MWFGARVFSDFLFLGGGGRGFGFLRLYIGFGIRAEGACLGFRVGKVLGWMRLGLRVSG